MRKNIFIYTSQFLFSLLAVLLLSLTAVPANAIDQINITVNPYDFTMNVTADMEYSNDNGETWNPCTDSQNVEDHQGETLLVRFAAVEDSIESDIFTVIVPVRGEAPALTIDNATESMNSTAAMEYSCDNGMNWAACLDDMSLSELTGTTLLMRYACDGTNPASKSVSMTVPVRNAAPQVSIDSYAGILTATGTHPEYLTENVWTAISADGLNISDMTGQELTVRESYDNEHFASLSMLVKVPEKDVISDLDATRPFLLNGETHVSYITGRTKTQVAPNANITRAEVAAILYRLLVPEATAEYETSTSPFHDVSADAWYGPAVSTLANMGALSIYQGAFEPNRSITRGELAAILASFCGTAGDFTEDWFTDISGSWAQEYINQAAAAGLVYGYTDGTFRPDQNITRAETIVMVNRILGRSVTADTVVNGYKTFDDVAADAWYYWDIVEASNLHTFQRDGAAEVWTALG